MTIRPSNPRPQRSFVSITVAILAIAPALMLAGCSGSDGSDDPSRSAAGNEPASSRVADSANVAPSVEETPCALLTADMVASLFDVPAAELEQSQPMRSSCNYTWEGGDRDLDVTVGVNDVFEDAGEASRRFRAVTRGMSGEDLDSAMAGIKEEAARQGAADSFTGRVVADVIVDSNSSKRGGSGGIRFEDVEGVGDEARFALTVGAGDLWVRAGNLSLTVAAYSGPSMPIPDKLGAMMTAHKAWVQDTLPQRKEAAIKVANAVVTSL